MSNREYVHFFPKARNRGDYPEKFSFTLVTEFSVLKQLLEENWTKSIIALDTETTSLNHEKAIVVGFSFCFDRLGGYYVPLNHSLGNIDSSKEVLILMSEFLKGKDVLFYNKRFDLRMLESIKFPINFNHFDVQCLVWLCDSNTKMPSLKWAENHFLGWEAETFEDLVQNHSIQAMNPQEVVQYAATDALGTFILFENLAKQMRDFKFAILLDNKALDVVKVIEEEFFLIDRGWLEGMTPEIDSELTCLRDELFKISGSYFNPDSPQQVGRVLLDNGCAPVERTKKGEVATGEDNLKKIKHPLIDAILKYRGLRVLRSSYVQKLINEESRSPKGLHISHKTCLVPCLTKESFLHSKRGVISIKDVRPGDVIWTLSGWDEVEYWEDMGRVVCWKSVYCDGLVRDEIVGTSFHPVLTTRGVKNLGSLKKGDRLFSCSYKLVRNRHDGYHYQEQILRNETVIEDSFYVGFQTVYDIRMKRDPWFLTNGVFTHNTGRICSGSDKSNDFFANVNIMSIPKPVEQFWVFEKKEDGALVGFDFYPLSSDIKKGTEEFNSIERKVEGMDQHLNVRTAFIPPKDFVWVSIDYAAQELRIPANLSLEPVFVDAFTRGVDVHMEIAKSMFGLNAGKHERNIAKILSFGLLYGGCVGPNSRIGTDKGLIKIRDLVGKEFNTWNGEEFVPAEAVMTGFLPLYEVTLSDRSTFEVTMNHIMFKCNGLDLEEVKMSEVKVGDHLPLSVSQPVESKIYSYDSGKDLEVRQFNSTNHILISHNSVDLWWAVGLFVGGGYFIRGNRAGGKLSVGVGWLFHPKFDSNERLVNLLEFLGLVVKKRKINKDGKLSLISVKVHSVAFCRFLEIELGLKYGKETPHSLWSETKANILAYAEGFTLADGTKDGTNMLTQNNSVGFRRVKDLQTLLNSIGVSSVYYKHPGLDRSSHKLCICGESACDQFDYKSRKIIDIKLISEKSEAFDVSVKKGKQAFTVNNILVHNTVWTIMNAAGCTEEEAREFKSKYEKLHKTLYRWKKSTFKRATRKGYCETYYHRPRRLRHWLSSSDWKDVKFGERSVWNSQIQGLGGDLLKIALIRIKDQLYEENKEWLKFGPIVYDEANFMIRKDRVMELIPKIVELMEIQEELWPVKMEVGIAIGKSWGSLFPFEFKDGELKPKEVF